MHFIHSTLTLANKQKNAPRKRSQMCGVNECYSMVGISLKLLLSLWCMLRLAGLLGHVIDSATSKVLFIMLFLT